MSHLPPSPVEDGSFAPRIAVNQHQRPPAKVLRQVTRAAGTNVPPSLVRRLSQSSQTSTKGPEPSAPSTEPLSGSVTPVSPEVPPEPIMQDDNGSTGLWKGTTGRQKAVLFVLAMTDLTTYMALSILAPFFPQEATQKGVSEFLSGWIFGIFSLVQCITSPLFGKLLPRMGARWTCLAGLFFTGGCTILFGFLEFIPGSEDNHGMFLAFCFLLRAFMALGASANGTASFAIAAATFSDNPATVLGLLETATGLGLMLGPAIGGVLYEVGGFVTPFTVLGSVMVLTVPISLCVLPPEVQEDGNVDSRGGSILTLLRIPAISITSITIFVSSMAWVVLDPTLEPHLRLFHLTPSVIGLIFLLMSACYAVCSPVWGWVADNVRDSAPMLVTGLLLMTLGFLLVGPSPLIQLWSGSQFRALWLDILALIILGFASSLALVPTYDKILDAAEQAGIGESMENYGAVAGIWNTAFSFGEFVGPVLAGWLVGLIGFPWALTGVSISCFLMGAVVFIMYLHEKRFGPYRFPPSTKNKQETCVEDERSPLLGHSINGQAPGYS